VVIAGAVLGAVFYSAVLTLHQVISNQHVAYAVYNSSLVSDSLLVHTTNRLYFADISLDSELFIWQLLGISQGEFETRYKSDIFSYRIEIDNFNFSTGLSMPRAVFFCDSPSISLSNNTTNALLVSVYVYDKNDNLLTSVFRPLLLKAIELL